MPAPVKTFADYFVFQSNDPSTDTEPSLVALQNGRLALAWSTDTGGNADRRYYTAIAGEKLSSTTTYQTLAFDEFNLTQAITPSGFRLSTWTRRDDATNDQDIYAAITGPTTAGDGPVIVPAFLVNTDQTAGNQYQPQAVALDETRFLIAWVDANSSRVRGTVVELSGQVLMAPFDISTSAVSQNFEIGLTPLTDGRVVVSYRTNAIDAAFRVLFNNGAPATAEIDYDGVAGGTGATTVAALADGRFAVVTLGPGFEITGRIFNNNGTVSVAQFSVLASGGDLPKAIGLPDGRFFVIVQTGGDIVGQMMKADGTKDGASFTVNSVTTGSQVNADLTLLADGRIAIVWQTTENGNNDIKLTILDPRETGISITGTSFGDNYLGTAFDDVIAAAGGNDVVDGGGGDDVLAGGNGNDRLTGGAGADYLRGDNGNDLLFGDAGNDKMEGGLGEDWHYVDDAGDLVIERAGEGYDRVVTSISYVLPAAAAIELMVFADQDGTDALDMGGNDYDNYLYANNGRNVLNGFFGTDLLEGRGGDDLLDGGLGVDTTNGGAGQDWHYVDNAGDIVIEAAGEGYDRVIASTSYTLGGAAEVELMVTSNDAGTFSIDLTGNGFDNYLYGNNGVNALSGGGGADILDGQGASDILTGGAGADSFLFTSALDPGNIDEVVDFVTGIDRIQLDDAVFAGLSLGTLSAGAFRVGSAAADADDRIIYNNATGALLFDADGAGGAAAIQFAVLNGVPALAASDFLVI